MSSVAGPPTRRRHLTAPQRLRRWVPHLFLIPLVVVWVYPFVWMVSSAFKSPSEMFLGDPLSVLPTEPVVDNFVRAWDIGNFGNYFLNTVVFSAGVVAIVVAVSSMAGYALGRGSLPGKRLVVAGLVMTMFLPKGFTIIPLFVLISNLGLQNSLAGVILAQAGPAHIIAILLFMGYFAGMPKELEESAVMDGANHLQIYARIMLPLARPVIGTVALFNFIAAWNEFLVPLVFTLARPDLRTLGVGMYNFVGVDTTDWTGLAAGACITIVPVVLVFLRLQKYFIEGIAGAVKG